jgi:hypothetical protein
VQATPLATPGIMMQSSEIRAAAMQELEETLTSMRQGPGVILKPLGIAKSKIAQSRVSRCRN